METIIKYKKLKIFVLSKILWNDVHNTYLRIMIQITEWLYSLNGKTSRKNQTESSFLCGSNFYIVRDGAVSATHSFR